MTPDGAEPLEDPGAVEGFARPGEHGLERRRGQEFHDVEQGPGELAEIKNSDDVRVIEAGDRAELAFEPVLGHADPAGVGAEDLEGALLPALAVTHRIDRSHSPLTEETQNLVAIPDDQADEVAFRRGLHRGDYRRRRGGGAKVDRTPGITGAGR